MHAHQLGSQRCEARDDGARIAVYRISRVGQRHDTAVDGADFHRRRSVRYPLVASDRLGRW